MWQKLAGEVWLEKAPQGQVPGGYILALTLLLSLSSSQTPWWGKQLSSATPYPMMLCFTPSPESDDRGLEISETVSQSQSSFILNCFNYLRNFVWQYIVYRSDFTAFRGSVSLAYFISHSLVCSFYILVAKSSPLCLQCILTSMDSFCLGWTLTSPVHFSLWVLN